MPERIGSLIEGLELACASSSDAPTLRTWRDLVRGRLSFQQLLECYRSKPRLTYLTIDTTGLCDLKCPGMCYYHPEIDTHRPPIETYDLKNAIDDASRELGLKMLVFAGKEPLLNFEKFFELVTFADQISARSFSIGAVSNGRQILRQWSRMSELARRGALAFLDISIDSGIEDQHDAIRGAGGTFALAREALERTARDWPQVRVGSTSVLRHDNAEGLIILIRKTAPFNRHFFITPIQPPTFSATLPLSWSSIQRFLEQLRVLLETELSDKGLEISVSLLGIHAADAVLSGLFGWHEMREDDLGQIFVSKEIGGNRFIFLLQIFPETGRSIARITYDGAYLPNTHFLQSPHPQSHAIGFLQEESLSTLYGRSLENDGVLATILSSRDGHACRNRSCWNSCFGGLAAAEHSFVGGAPLKNQSFLCLKTDKDFESALRKE